MLAEPFGAHRQVLRRAYDQHRPDSAGPPAQPSATARSPYLAFSTVEAADRSAKNARQTYSVPRKAAFLTGVCYPSTVSDRDHAFRTQSHTELGAHHQRHAARIKRCSVAEKKVLDRDLNGDGRADVVFADFTSSLSVLISKGDGNFAAGVSYPIENIGNQQARSLVVGDVNGNYDSTYIGWGAATCRRSNHGHRNRSDCSDRSEA